MIGDKSQVQRAGDSSVNVQAHNVYIAGISASDARQIALDVYKSNFAALSQEAVSTAFRRAEKLTDDLIEKLATQDGKLFAQFQSPGMQLALLAAQREYARTGDDIVEKLLVSILVERAKTHERTLWQIALEEAISVIPKLTEKQLNILTLSTLLNDHYFIGGTIDGLKWYLSTVMRFEVTISFRSPEIQHIEFTGCAKVRPFDSNSNLDVKLKKSFPGLFPSGFTEEQFKNAVPNSERFHVLLEPLRTAGLLKFKPASFEGINSFFETHGLGDEEKKPLFDFLRLTSLDPKGVRSVLIAIQPGIEFLFSFANAEISDLALTPVGIAIAAANYTRTMGHSLALPYSMRDI